MRRLLLAAVVGWLVLTPAGPAAARTTKQPPIEIPSGFGHAEGTLKDRGFLVNVSWRIASHQDVVVRDYGGGPSDPLQRTRDIETAVWTNEPIRFDRLVIENHTGAKTRFTIGYQDLQASLGPRPADVDAQTPGVMLALSTVFGLPARVPRTSSTSWLLIPGVVVGPLALAVLLVALIAIGRQRRSGNASTHRLAG